MSASSGDEIVVCLGYPDLGAPHYLERLRAIDARIRPVVLPFRSGDVSWRSVSPGEPHPEPPPWAQELGAERRAALRQAEVLIALHTPAELDALAPRLRWVQGVGAGVEQFALAGVARAHTIVTNASGLGAPSMAEFVMGRLLAVWKRFREMESLQREHRYKQAYGRTFRGSTVGIVGMGAIGQAVAERARGFGARVVGMKRSAPSAEDRSFADRFYRPDELHAMLGECDAVVVAAPATPETHHLLDTAAFAAMKPGAVFVNVARGSLVDETALLGALEQGQVSVAALDVFDQEPLPPEHPFWAREDVYVSAHSSVSIDRYIDDIFDLFEENLRRYVVGEPLRNRVDMERLGFA